MEFSSFAGLAAALMVGIAGGVAHCPLMCGGLALAGGRIGEARGRARLRLALLHVGRMSTYLLLALLLSAVGDTLAGAGAEQARRGWQLLLGALLLALAFDQLGRGQLAARLSASVGPIVHRALKRARNAGLPASFAAGMAWGLVPCMLSWTAIVAAATLPLASTAAAIGVFGVATALPLSVFHGVDHYLSAHSKLRWQKITHVAMAAYGLLMLAQATTLLDPHAGRQSDGAAAIGNNESSGHSHHHH